MIKNNARDTAYHLIAEVYTHPAIIWFQGMVQYTIPGVLTLAPMYGTPEAVCQKGYADQVLAWAKRRNDEFKSDNDAGLNC